MLSRFGRAGISQVRWKSSARGNAVLWVASQAAPTCCWRGGCRLDLAWAGVSDGARPPRGTHEAVLVCAHWDGTSLGCARCSWDRDGCWLRVLGPQHCWGAAQPLHPSDFLRVGRGQPLPQMDAARRARGIHNQLALAQREPWLLGKA